MAKPQDLVRIVHGFHFVTRNLPRDVEQGNPRASVQDGPHWNRNPVPFGLARLERFKLWGAQRRELGLFLQRLARIFFHTLCKPADRCWDQVENQGPEEEQLRAVASLVVLELYMVAGCDGKVWAGRQERK